MTDEEKKQIGASDAAAIAGISPHRAPIDVWRRIVEGVETPDSKPLRRGRLLEPVIRQMVIEDYGLTLLGPRKLTDPKRPYLRMSLDDVAQDAEGEEPVEFKSVSPWVAHQFGEPGTDELPIHYSAQVQIYLAGHGAPRAKVYALIGSDELRDYVVTADVEIQGMLLEKIDKFHRDHVLTGKPPPIDGSEGYSEYLKNRFPTSAGHMREADALDVAAVRALVEAKDATKKAEEHERKCRNALVARIGEFDGLIGQCSNKLTKGRASTDWPNVAAELASKYGITQAQINEAIERHTARNPYKVLRITGGKQ
jgi:putative phage-type endonuclease